MTLEAFFRHLGFTALLMLLSAATVRAMINPPSATSVRVSPPKGCNSEAIVRCVI